MKGFSTAQKLDKLGMRGSNTCEVYLFMLFVKNPSSAYDNSFSQQQQQQQNLVVFFFSPSWYLRTVRCQRRMCLASWIAACTYSWAVLTTSASCSLQGLWGTYTHHPCKLKTHTHARTAVRKHNVLMSGLNYERLMLAAVPARWLHTPNAHIYTRTHWIAWTSTHMMIFLFHFPSFW